MGGKQQAPPTCPPDGSDCKYQDGLRILSRFPHPYHRVRNELLEPSGRLTPFVMSTAVTLPSFPKESTPVSESGTEADDEHILKRLPAPRARLHKGIRGRNEVPSGESTPLLSSAPEEEVKEERRGDGRRGRLHLSRENSQRGRRTHSEKSRRRREIWRRATEALLLVCQGGLLVFNETTRPLLRLYRRELCAHSLLLAALLALYPLRLLLWSDRRGKAFRTVPISIPTSFDPASLFYPTLIPLFVSILTSANVGAAILPNLVLCICALPRALIPTVHHNELINPLHWLLSLVPVWAFKQGTARSRENEPPLIDVLDLVYPLHQIMCLILYHLTTTSLLTAELQLLSVSLINVYLLARSPQAVILKSLLWVGGLSVIVLCGPVIRWGISLARVPKWRLRRVPRLAKSNSFSLAGLATMWPKWRPKRESWATDPDESTCVSENSSDEDYEAQMAKASGPLANLGCHRRAESMGSHGSVRCGSSTSCAIPATIAENGMRSAPEYLVVGNTLAKRHTIPASFRSCKTHTPSGRPKLSASSSVRALFALTQQQAALRKWIYAGHVYVCIIAVILGGVRGYVQRYALSGDEPIGWALGYLLGDLPRFRFEVVKANLEHWICLPQRTEDVDDQSSSSQGWVQHLRHAYVGEANTRLGLAAYFLGVTVTGLAVVLQLSPVCEVDTRRKVFHFMMVAMFLPSIFVDPTFVALALSLMLAIFLLLDLIRASQLPPLSRPISAFLTPYVDGRDLRGPVVISHIFLLIGCAIPLWLSLASLPRTGTHSLAGWEVPTRDVSMVAGVVCVGLGDAAASLIGRRWGHRKWAWGGGKSLEGSLAFAAAVFAGLMAAQAWLRLGGWLGGRSLSLASLGPMVGKTGACAFLASLTEAVLTGGNDNVVVPVVLWTCVKGVGL